MKTLQKEFEHQEAVTTIIVQGIIDSKATKNSTSKNSMKITLATQIKPSKRS